jgi:hypothetical protein
MPWKGIVAETVATILTAILTYAFIVGKFVWSGNLWWVVPVVVMFAYIARPIIQVYISLLVLFLTRVRIIPQASFIEGIPAVHRAAIVHCVRATSESVIDLAMQNLWESAHANQDINMYAIYLSDTSDPTLVMSEIKNIRQLQERDDLDRIFLFHRDTHWGKKWGAYQDLMSWLNTGENAVQYYTDASYGRNKRSTSQKLFGFTCLNAGLQDSLLTRSEITTGIIGHSSKLKGSIRPSIPYLLISDADVAWPQRSAIKTVEKMAHPENGAFTIFQPLVAIGNDNSTLFTKLLSWGRLLGEYLGLSIWKIYDAYLFFGKGGVKVEKYMDVMMAKGNEILNPDLLSHDFVEARYLRTAYLPDIQVTENAPLDYLSDLERMRRWFLGDIVALYHEYIRPTSWKRHRSTSRSPMRVRLKPLPLIGNSLTHLVIDYDFVPIAFSVFMMFMVLASCIPGIYLIADARAEIGSICVILIGIFLIPKFLGPIACSIHLRRPMADALREVRHGLPELLLSTVLFLQHLVDRIIILIGVITVLWRFFFNPADHPLEWEPSLVSQKSVMLSASLVQIYWKRRVVVLVGMALVISLALAHGHGSLWYMSPFWISFILGPLVVYKTCRISGRLEE